ncbi:hypothetical protein BUALT_Bualt01G0141800 [Buddleja alternifolia]|uniref:C2 domain-containing protein n=1 Tax=Buddleja alternifolia TaxID=168488 RepID=A0AAV6Y8J4_9LAMI|nr:hypothetical protein BUALT_Bualt01G0141800 [Buddleja alternifolia]
MEYRALKIRVISGKDLKDVKLFSLSKMDVYAEVSIAGYPQSMKKTLVDKDCGSNPKWNNDEQQLMEFIVDEPYLAKPGLSLLFQLKAQSSFGKDKQIGSVTIPIHHLEFQPNSQDRVIEYQVITTSGKPKGSLKFSYRFGEKFIEHAQEPVTAYPAPPPRYAAAAPHPGMGYPPPPSGYPQTSGYGYPPQQGYVGYPPPPKKNKMGMGSGLGMGLGAGLLGGLLVGEMASDIGDASAYADGYGDAMGGDFDF